MNDGGGNRAGCFEVKIIWADTAKFTDSSKS